MLSMATGLPGASKSYLTCQTTLDLLKRNMRWYKKTGIVRPVVSNLVLEESFTKEVNSECEFLQYWEDPEILPSLKNCDVVWEEMGAHVDSRSWEQLPLPLRRWVQQHRHRGVDIYGNCQDFADVDVAIRRLCGSLVYLTKIMGSRDPSPTTPPVEFVWGVVIKMYLDPRNYKEETKLTSGVFGGVIFLRKSVVDLYSMFNDIKPGKYPPLQHRERLCPDCGFKKVLHV